MRVVIADDSRVMREGIASLVRSEGIQVVAQASSPQELLAAALASCTAITMEMYAERKGWDIGEVEVECQYSPAERGCPTRFQLVLRFPESLDEGQVERLKVIAAKCPVHRTLDGEVMFNERVERLQLQTS